MTNFRNSSTSAETVLCMPESKIVTSNPRNFFHFVYLFCFFFVQTETGNTIHNKKMRTKFDKYDTSDNAHASVHCSFIMKAAEWRWNINYFCLSLLLALALSDEMIQFDRTKKIKIKRNTNKIVTNEKQTENVGLYETAIKQNTVEKLASNISFVPEMANNGTATKSHGTNQVTITKKKTRAPAPVQWNRCAASIFVAVYFGAKKSRPRVPLVHRRTPRVTHTQIKKTILHYGFDGALIWPVFGTKHSKWNLLAIVYIDFSSDKLFHGKHSLTTFGQQINGRMAVGWRKNCFQYQKPSSGKIWIDCRTWCTGTICDIDGMAGG